MRLYMLPYAGGSSTVYTKWKRYFDPSAIECVPMEINGRGSLTGVPFFTDMDAAVHSLIAGYLNDSSEKTALFGHSMGGVLAFEIARVLTKIGRPPVHLFISGANTPDYQEDTWDVQSMNDEQFLNHLAKIGGFQEEFFDNPAYQAYFLPILRADYALLRSRSPYHPQALPCGITVFTGMDDPYSMENIEHWEEFSEQELTVYPLKGNHFFLHEQAESMSKIIITQLQAAMRKEG